MSEKSKDYERLTQSIYAAMLAAEGVGNIEVGHDVRIKGKSGVKHQIDVFWEFTLAGAEHRVAVECKHYGSAVELGHVRSFTSVVDDIAPCNGIMVTKVGYQNGAVNWARHHRIKLMLLKSTDDDDWGAVPANIRPTFVWKRFGTSDVHPLKVSFVVDKRKVSARVDALVTSEERPLADLANFRLHSHLLHSDGSEYEVEFSRWLSRKVGLLQLSDGGPYWQTIPTSDVFIRLNLEGDQSELVQVRGVDVNFYVESEEVASPALASDVIKAILFDYTTPRIEGIEEA